MLGKDGIDGLLLLRLRICLINSPEVEDDNLISISIILTYKERLYLQIKTTTTQVPRRVLIFCLDPSSGLFLFFSQHKSKLSRAASANFHCYTLPAYPAPSFSAGKLSSLASLLRVKYSSLKKWAPR